MALARGVEEREQLLPCSFCGTRHGVHEVTMRDAAGVVHRWYQVAAGVWLFVGAPWGTARPALAIRCAGCLVPKVELEPGENARTG